MVRKNPLTDRGPAPPGGRVRPKPEGATRPATLFELRPETEYIRLWDCLVSTATEQIDTIHHFASLAVPGVPVSQLQALRDRIDQIIQREARSHE
jgi:hypothetical protein